MMNGRLNSTPGFLYSLTIPHALCRICLSRKLVATQAAVMVLKTLINCRNPYKSGAIEWHSRIFFHKNSKIYNSAQINCAFTS